MICNRKRLGLGLLMTAVGLLPFSLQVFVTIDLRIRPEMFGYDNAECYYAEGHAQFVMDIWPWLDFCLYAFVPLVFIFVSNIIILTFLWKAHVNRKKLSFHASESTAKDRKHKKDKATATSFGKMKSLTAMLLSRTVAFLVLFLPFSIYSIGLPTWQKSQDFEYHERLYLVHAVTILLAYLAHATNFFLYCASGPQFSKAAKEMLCFGRKTNHSSARYAASRSNSGNVNWKEKNIQTPTNKSIAMKESTSNETLTENQKHNITIETSLCIETEISDNKKNDLLGLKGDKTNTNINDNSDKNLDDNVNIIKGNVVSENEVLITVTNGDTNNSHEENAECNRTDTVEKIKLEGNITPDDSEESKQEDPCTSFDNPAYCTDEN